MGRTAMFGFLKASNDCLPSAEILCWHTPLLLLHCGGGRVLQYLTVLEVGIENENDLPIVGPSIVDIPTRS